MALLSSYVKKIQMKIFGIIFGSLFHLPPPIESVAKSHTFNFSPFHSHSSDSSLSYYCLFPEISHYPVNWTLCLHPFPTSFMSNMDPSAYLSYRRIEKWKGLLRFQMKHEDSPGTSVTAAVRLAITETGDGGSPGFKASVGILPVGVQAISLPLSSIIAPPLLPRCRSHLVLQLFGCYSIFSFCLLIISISIQLSWLYYVM